MEKRAYYVLETYWWHFRDMPHQRCKKTLVLKKVCVSDMGCIDVIFPHIWCKRIYLLCINRYLAGSLCCCHLFFFIPVPFLTPSAYVFNTAKVHTVYEINKIHFSIFMYKYVKKMLPLSFKNMFILNSDIHSIQTRNSSNFYVPFPRIDKFKFSVIYAAPSVWNSLSEINKNLDTIHKFKNNIKHYMLTHRII